jgi:hypothetical protein
MAPNVNTVQTGNNFMMVALVPLPAQLHGWLNKAGKVSKVPATTLPMKGSMPTPVKPVSPTPAPTPVTETADQKPAPAAHTTTADRVQNAVWSAIRRLQSMVSEDDSQVAQQFFSIDEDGRIRLSIPAFDWPELPYYATREGIAEAFALLQTRLPSIVGATIYTAGIAYLQPTLTIRYATRRIQSSLYPWLGTGAAKLAARPATVLAAAGGLPVLLAALPAYYIYLVLNEAIRVATELAADARQLATVVQLVMERCEPVFRAADGLPADAALRVIAVGLKQHLPEHVNAVVQQAVYVGRLTGNMSARLTSVLEAAADWARSEQGLEMLDHLVHMTNNSSDPAYGLNAPCAA